MCTRGLVGRHPRPANSAQAATSRGRRSARGPATGTLPRPGNGPTRSDQQETAMSAQSPALAIPADTVPGRRGALTASPSQAVPATSPTGGRLPLSAAERTRHRRFRHLGRADRDCLYAVLDAGLVAHLGVITGGGPLVVPTQYGFTADTLYPPRSVAPPSLNTPRTPRFVTHSPTH